MSDTKGKAGRRRYFKIPKYFQRQANNQLTVAAISELMTYNSPPNPVKYVGRLIAIMLNPSILEFKDSTGKFAVDYWKEFRQVLKRRSFIQELFNFDFSSCENPDVYTEVKRLVEENKNVLDENTIHNASVVVLCLYRFALIQLNIVEMKMKIELTQSKQTHASYMMAPSPSLLFPKAFL